MNRTATIGIFSSSSPISATVPVRYERGKQYLENKGFKVIDGSLYGKQDFYRSGTIKERADEFINWTTQDRSKEQRKNEWLCINPGVCRGRLIGGNLHTMWGFFGTEYMPEIKVGDILLIEDTYKDAFTMEKLFSMLKLAGVFEKVGGIILGKHERFQDGGTGRKPYEILLEEPLK